MDGALGTEAGSIDEVNRILQLASAQTLDLAKKLVKVAVEQAVGREVRAQQREEKPDHGKGEEEREDRLADHAPAPVQVDRVLGSKRGVRQE